MIDDGEAFSDLFYAENGTLEYGTQLDTGSYATEDGHLIYFDVSERHYEGRSYTYDFIVPLENNIGAWISFRASELNRERDEPFFRSIAACIKHNSFAPLTSA